MDFRDGSHQDPGTAGDARQKDEAGSHDGRHGNGVVRFMGGWDRGFNHRGLLDH